MPKVFVSYARPTATRARAIAEALRAEGHDVWIDDALLAHRSFTDAIEEQLDAADAVVVVWSAEAARSEWVRAEASRARKAGKLVQVTLEACDLPMPYDQIHCVDLSNWSGDYALASWRAVLASIAAVLQGGARSDRPASDDGRIGPAPSRPGPGERRAERRQVTALSCDLMDAAALTASLDPEDMMQILDGFHAACEDSVVRHGGSIAKLSSQGVLAYFGYPRASEDEAADAVRAALALRRAVTEIEAPGGVALRSRAGVATGVVVVTDLVGSGGGRDIGVVGEASTLAALLEASAGPDEVVVSDTTRRITEGLFTYRDLGTRTLGGYDRPVAAHAALAATAADSRSEARAAGQSSPLVGREAELALMSQAWELAEAGEGQVILIQGEAGIGKSRLVEAFRSQIAGRPHAQSVWYCGPNHAGTVLHPIIEGFARAAGFEHGDSPSVRLDRLTRLLGAYGEAGEGALAVLADLLGLPGEPLSASPDRRKALTLATLLAMMDTLADDQTALFVFEDLHWADPTTLELIDRAIRIVSDKPWVILATARPEFEARWSEHADVTHIQPGRLSRAEAGRICAALGAEAILSIDQVGQIIERTDGNPLFIEEMTKSVLEAIPLAPGGEGGGRAQIPFTLHDSLVARLDRLGPIRQIAALGATIGRRFGYALLAAVAPVPAADLRQALRELARSGLIDRSGVPPNSHYLFRHALIRDAAYESLLKKEREALHGRIAAALQESFPETCEAEPALVAYHLTESGDLAAAIPLWVEAGGRALARAAYSEAVSQLQTARLLVRRLQPDEGRLRLELQILLGVAVGLSGLRSWSAPEVGATLVEARGICEQLGDQASLFAVLRNICNFSITASDLPAAEEAALRCRAIGEATGRIEPLIEADCALGWIFAARGRLPVALEHLRRAIDAYRTHDGARLTFPTPQDPLVVSLSTLPMVLNAMGERVQAERAAGELVEHARALGQPFSLVWGLCFAAAHELAVGRFQQALRYTQEALDLLEANTYDNLTAVASLLKALALGGLGEVKAAITLATWGVGELERLGMNSFLSFYLGGLAELQFASGAAGAALGTLDKAIAHSARYDDNLSLAPNHMRRGAVMAALPDADQQAVVAAYQEAMDIAERQGAAAYVALAKGRLTQCEGASTT